MIGSHLPPTKRSLVKVRWRSNSPYLFAARRSDEGVVVETGLTFWDSRIHQIMIRAACAALELLEHRTTAIIVRAPTKED